MKVTSCFVRSAVSKWSSWSTSDVFLVRANKNRGWWWSSWSSLSQSSWEAWSLIILMSKVWWSSTSGVFLDKQIRREADNDHYDQVHLNHNNQHDHLDEQSVSRDHHDMVVIINTWCVSSASKQGQRLIMDHPASDGPEYTKHQPCIIITDVIVATSRMAQMTNAVLVKLKKHRMNCECCPCHSLFKGHYECWEFCSQLS